MGLSVARDILRAHGGEVYLTSSSQRGGTEFVLAIPLAVRDSAGKELEPRIARISRMEQDGLRSV
jgi:signal transduction histidine kinase